MSTWQYKDDLGKFVFVLRTELKLFIAMGFMFNTYDPWRVVVTSGPFVLLGLWVLWKRPWVRNSMNWAFFFQNLVIAIANAYRSRSHTRAHIRTDACLCLPVRPPVCPTVRTARVRARRINNVPEWAVTLFIYLGS